MVYTCHPQSHDASNPPKKNTHKTCVCIGSCTKNSQYLAMAQECRVPKNTLWVKGNMFPKAAAYQDSPTACFWTLRDGQMTCWRVLVGFPLRAKPIWPPSSRPRGADGPSGLWGDPRDAGGQGGAHPVAQWESPGFALVGYHQETQ